MSERTDPEAERLRAFRAWYAQHPRKGPGAVSGRAVKLAWDAGWRAHAHFSLPGLTEAEAEWRDAMSSLSPMEREFMTEMLKVQRRLRE